jgi:hypothetical protein
LAFLRILSSMARTLWSVIRRPWMAPLRWIGSKKGPGSDPLLLTQASSAAFAPFVACPVLAFLPLPDLTVSAPLSLVVVREVEGHSL